MYRIRCLALGLLLVSSCAIIAVTRPSQEKAPEMRRVVIRYVNKPSVVLEIVDQVFQKQVEDEVSHFTALPPVPDGVIPRQAPTIMDIDMERDDGSKKTVSISRGCEVAYIKGKEGRYSVDEERSALLQALVSVLEARHATQKSLSAPNSQPTRRR